MKLLRYAVPTLVVAFVAVAAARGAALADADKSPSGGVAVFTSKCAPCHGKTGTPNEQYAKLGVRKLSDPEWQKSKTDEQIHEVIAHGSKGTQMRAFKELKPAEIDALVKYVRTLNGAPAK
jgi:mono/diheme cytochrome c family protein